MHRYNIVKKLYVKDVPFIFGQGLYMGSEGLKPNDTIEQAIKNGTLAIGFIGLAETLVALTGKHHAESETSQKMGLDIVTQIRKFCDEASDRNDLNFTCFSSPAEGLAKRFVEMDKKLYGEIPGVTDKDYYINSFHVPPAFEIDAYRKVEIEAPYHALCNAGHISYLELGESPNGNVEGLYKLICHAVEQNQGYFAYNYPMDYCNKCNKTGSFNDQCPYCGSEDLKRTRRITGYFSEEENFNSGKAAELKDRVVHTSRVIKHNEE